MSPAEARQLCGLLFQAHGRLRRQLDDELGTQHGLSLADHALLQALAPHAQGLSTQALAQSLDLPASAVVRQAIALEKTGWLERLAGPGERRLRLRAPGHGLLREASDTLTSICHAALQAEPAPDDSWLHALAGRAAWAP